MLSHIRTSFHLFFQADKIKSIAKATGLIRRERKLTASGFFMRFAFFKSDTLGYSDLASDFTAETGESISGQAIGKKMAQAEVFFETLAKGAIEDAKFSTCHTAIKIPGVSHIRIADSSIISFNKALASVLPGTGGKGGEASAKLHTVFNLTNQTVSYLSLREGKASEHAFKEAHAKITKPGDLIIRDLGFFDVEDLSALNDEGKYFLSRIPLSVKAFKNEAGEEIDLWNKLASSQRFSHEESLSIAGGTVLMRVVAVRLPKHKWQERLATMRGEKGRTLSKTEKAQAKWNLLVTNLSAEC